MSRLQIDNFGPRSGTTFCRPNSGSKLFDTLVVFLKELIRKQISRRPKHVKLPSMQIVNFLILCRELNILLFSCDLVIVAVMYKTNITTRKPVCLHHKVRGPNVAFSATADSIFL